MLKPVLKKKKSTRKKQTFFFCLFYYCVLVRLAPVEEWENVARQGSHSCTPQRLCRRWRLLPGTSTTQFSLCLHHRQSWTGKLPDCFLMVKLIKQLRMCLYACLLSEALLTRTLESRSSPSNQSNITTL